MIRRDGLYLAASAVQMVGSLVLTPVSTRLLGPAEYGAVVTGTIVMQVVFVLAGLGLATSLQRAHARLGRERTRALLLLSVVASAAVCTLLTLTGPLWVGVFGLPGFTAVPATAVWWAGLSAVTAAQLAVLRSEDRVRGFALLSVLQTLVADGLAVAALLLVGRTATVFVLAELGAQVITVLAGLLLIPPRWVGLERQHVRTLLLFGLPLVPSAFATIALGSVDKIVIRHDLGSAEVARYQVAFVIGSVPVLLLGMVNSVWLPRFFAATAGSAAPAPGPGRSAEAAGAGDATTADLDAQGRDVIYRLLPWVLLGMAATSPLVLDLWAPGSFRTHSLRLIAVVVSLATIPYAAALAAARPLLAHGRSRAVAVGNAVGAVGCLLLNLLLVPRLGLLGAAMSCVTAYALIYLATRLLARRLVDYRPRFLPSLGWTLLAALLAPAWAGYAAGPGWDVPHVVLTLVAGSGGLLALRSLVRGGPGPAREPVPADEPVPAPGAGRDRAPQAHRSRPATGEDISRLESEVG